MCIKICSTLSARAHVARMRLLRIHTERRRHAHRLALPIAHRFSTGRAGPVGTCTGPVAATHALASRPRLTALQPALRAMRVSPIFEHAACGYPLSALSNLLPICLRFADLAKTRRCDEPGRSFAADSLENPPIRPVDLSASRSADQSGQRPAGRFVQLRKERNRRLLSPFSTPTARVRPGGGPATSGCLLLVEEEFG